MKKKIEKNISKDDERNLYYVTLYYGTDQNGKNIKKTKTTTGIKEAQGFQAASHGKEAAYGGWCTQYRNRACTAYSALLRGFPLRDSSSELHLLQRRVAADNSLSAAIPDPGLTLGYRVRPIRHMPFQFNIG